VKAKNTLPCTSAPTGPARTARSLDHQCRDPRHHFERRFYTPKLRVRCTCASLCFAINAWRCCPPRVVRAPCAAAAGWTAHPAAPCFSASWSWPTALKQREPSRHLSPAPQRYRWLRLPTLPASSPCLSLHFSKTPVPCWFGLRNSRAPSASEHGVAVVVAGDGGTQGSRDEGAEAQHRPAGAASQAM
jgi:hypothetical protein